MHTKKDILQALQELNSWLDEDNPLQLNDSDEALWQQVQLRMETALTYGEPSTTKLSTEHRINNTQKALLTQQKILVDLKAVLKNQGYPPLDPDIETTVSNNLYKTLHQALSKL